MTEVKPLGLGLIGAGGFARFVLSALADLPDVRLVAVTDTDSSQARRLAGGSAQVTKDVAAMLECDEVEVVLIATPPHTHAELTIRALAAGRQVFCEKPVALTEADADRVLAAVIAGGRAYVVDHVLRYNPILAGIRRLHAEGLLPRVQRLAFENDAADEDLPPGHWFWNDAISGGILLEHGVHFFDAAAMLLATPPCRVQAISGRRPDGRTDSVVCTVEHDEGVLASYAHGFSHPHRAERQLMRLDFGQWVSHAEVAEVPFTAFASRARKHAVTARLIVGHDGVQPHPSRRRAGLAVPRPSDHGHDPPAADQRPCPTGPLCPPHPPPATDALALGRRLARPVHRRTRTTHRSHRLTTGPTATTTEDQWNNRADRQLSHARTALTPHQDQQDPAAIRFGASRLNAKRTHSSSSQQCGNLRDHPAPNLAVITIHTQSA